MITTTLGELVNAYGGLRAVLALDLPSKTSFHAAKLARLIMGDVQSFNQERDALLQKYGTKNKTKDGEPETYTLVGKKRTKFESEFKDLSETVATVDYAPLTLAMLDGRNISGENLLALGPLLAEE